MIDASLGRAGCCCGQNAAGQVFAEAAGMCCPTPVQSASDALSIQLANTQSAVANGAVIPLGGSVRQIGTALTYDPANHAVAVNEPGVYAFRWSVLVQSTDAPADAVISLQSLDGSAVLASSGAIDVPAEGGTLVCGTAVAQLCPGTSWALVNNSGVPVNVPAAGTAPAAFAASETVVKV